MNLVVMSCFVYVRVAMHGWVKIAEVRGDREDRGIECDRIETMILETRFSGPGIR